MSSEPAVNRPPRRPRGRPPKDTLTSEETRDRLLEAAEEAFVELGYDGVTINEIVRRAGYTTGAIYNHFDGKAEILVEVVNRVLARISDVIRAASVSEDVTTQGAALIDAWFALSRADRLTLSEVNQAASRHDRVRELLNQALSDAFSSTKAYFEQAQRSGQANRDLDAGRIARILLVLCAGLNHLDTIDPKMGDDELTREYVIEWISQLHWLQTPVPRRARRLRRRHASD